MLKRGLHNLFILLLVTCCGRSLLEPFEGDVALSSSFLRFTAHAGEPVADQVVTLESADRYELNWRAVVDAPWLLVEPRSGTTGATPILVSVRTSGIAPGTHQAGIRFVIDSADEESRDAGLVVELQLDAPGWMPLDGPSCGHIKSIAVDPLDPNRVLAGGTDGRFYSSADGGASFTAATSPLDEYAVLHQTAWSRAGRAYMAVDTTCDGDAGVLRSDDGGISWTATSLQNVVIRGVGTLPQDEDYVLAVGEGVWMSTDGGVNWNLIDALLDVDRLSTVGDAQFFLRTRDSRLFSVSSAGVLTELTLTDALTVTARAGNRLAAATDASPFVVHTSDDGGSSWSQRAGLGMPYDNCTVPVNLTSDGDLLYTVYEELYVSADDGESFFTIPETATPLSASGYLRDAAAHPDGVLVAHGSDGVLRRGADGNLTPSKILACDVQALEYHPGSGFLFGLTSPGGGFRWAPNRGFESLALPYDPNASYKNISIDPRNAATTLIAADECYGFCSTNDGGDSWSQDVVGLTNDVLKGIARAPDDPDTLFVASCTDGLFRSTDGGASFAFVAAGDADHVAALSSSVAIYGGSSGVYVWNGTTATLVDSESITTVDATADGSLWYGDDAGGTLRSTDGGLTFVALGLEGGIPLDIVVHPADSSWIFVAMKSGLFESRDNGANWSEIAAPFPPTALTVDPDAEAIFVGTRGGGVYRYTP